MLARLERTLPKGEAWRYEPKLDGFRGLLWRAPSGSVHLLSRDLRDLSHAFNVFSTEGIEHDARAAERHDLTVDQPLNQPSIHAQAGG